MLDKKVIFFLIVTGAVALTLTWTSLQRTTTQSEQDAYVQKLNLVLQHGNPPEKLLRSLPFNELGNLWVLHKSFLSFLFQGKLTPWLEAVKSNIDAFGDLDTEQKANLVREICTAEFHLDQRGLCSRLVTTHGKGEEWSLALSLENFLNQLKVDISKKFYSTYFKSPKSSCPKSGVNSSVVYLSSQLYQMTGDLKAAADCLAPFANPSIQDWKKAAYYIEIARIRLLQGRFPDELQKASETGFLLGWIQKNRPMAMEVSSLLAMGWILRGDLEKGQKMLKSTLNQFKDSDLHALSGRIQYLLDHLHLQSDDLPAPQNFNTWLASEFLRTKKRKQP